MPFRTVLPLGVIGACLVLASGTARAQEDWSLTRPSPSNATPRVPGARTPRPAGRIPSTRAEPDLVERYLRILLQEPEDAFALGRLRELSMAKQGSLEPLVLRLSQMGEQADGLAAQEVLARLWLSEGQLALAERAVERLLGSASDRPSARLLEAHLRTAQGNAEAARGAYEEVLRLAPRGVWQVRALRGLSQLALQAGDIAGARAHFERLQRTDPQSGRTAFARALVESGRHNEAAAEYLRAAEQMRGDPRAQSPLLREAAREEMAAGDFDRALSTLQRARGAARSSEQLEIAELELQLYRRLERLPELAARLEQSGDFGRAAEVWEELGEDGRALAAVRKQLARHARDLDAKERLSRVLLRAGQFEELERVYRELVRGVPGEPQHAVALAKMLRDSGRSDEALALLDGVSARAATSVSVHRAFSELFTQWGEGERASRELAQLARLEPDDPSHVVALGEEAFARGQRRQALEIWQRLLKGAKNEHEGQLALAMVLSDHDCLEEALAAVSRAQVLAPNDIEAQRLLASLLERAGRSRDAEQAWLSLVRWPGVDDAVVREARQHLVTLWRREGASKRKLKELEQRALANPRDAEALWLLAEIYAREPGLSGREVTLLEQLLALTPNHMDTLRALERAYGRRGDTPRVLAVLERMIVVEPQAAASHLARAMQLAVESYQDDAALSYATRALSLKPNDAKTQKLVGDLYRRRQDFARAAQAYEQAARIDPQDFETRVLLAQLETARGHAGEAFGWWLEVARGARDDVHVIRAVRSASELVLDDAQRTQLETVLLEGALREGDRPTHRRLLLECYERWFGFLHQSVEPDLNANVRAAVARLSRRALKPLIEALSDESDRGQRLIALRLLGLLRAKAAAPALSTFAERSGAEGERALSLVALGEIGEVAIVPRLQRLMRSGERRLRPFVLWALLRSADDTQLRGILSKALVDSEPGVRMMASLALGDRGFAAWEDKTSLSVTLGVLALDRHASVRASAGWALSLLRGSTGGLPCDLPEGPDAWMTLLAQRTSPAVVTCGLLNESSELRDLAAALALGRPAVEGVSQGLQAPRWPFHAREYLKTWVERQAGPRVDFTERVALLEALWPVLTARAQALLASPELPAVRAGLASLQATRSGLVPAAIGREVECAMPQMAARLASELAPMLHALAQTHGTFRLAALNLLLAAPSNDSVAQAALRPVLSDPSDGAFESLLARLSAQGGPVAPHVQSALLAAFDRSGSWSQRLQIARVLGPDVGSQRMRAEPVALIRAAAREVRRTDPAESLCRGRSSN